MITKEDIQRQEEHVEKSYPIDDNNRVVIYKLARPDGTFDYIVSRQVRMWYDEPVFQNPTFSTINDADDYVVVEEMKNFKKERAVFTGEALSEEDQRRWGIIE